MSARKLQQEFDKTNKKVAEGLSLFDDIYEKLMTTEISSQKEKLESDLKKEIKKLQRSRDLLKTWLSDGSIKLDKSLLQDNRTKIEHAMDLFKDLEKSSKIKQFSNEGLELQSQRTKLNKFNDPEDAKKHEASSYVGDIIDQINQQNESLELELHQLALQLKKSKSSNSYSIQASIDDSKYKVERNNSHLTKLERILRNLENEKLDPERIEDIKDDLEYYVENNQDDDYVEYDEFYDQLDINDDNLDVQGTLLHATRELSVDPEVRTEETKEKSDLPLGTLETEPENVDALKSELLKSEHGNLESVKSEVPKSEQAKATIAKPETTRVEPKPLASTIATSGSNTPVKKKIVPAPNPPPLTNANSYSTIIKAAQAAVPSGGAEVNNSVGTTPVKALPPGLNQSIRSRTVSPQVSTLVLDTTTDGRFAQQTVLPKISGDENLFDIIPKMSNILSSRLQNPISFPSIGHFLESSLLNCPDSFDAEVPRQYQPLNIHPSSIDYPQEPMYELNSSHVMKKFDNDTLFFCFYYCDNTGSLAKWNAAKELSSRGWIFNTETSQWFSKDQKNASKNKPFAASLNGSNQTNDSDSDKDNYKYFDYEKTWLIRRKENYVFEKELRESFV
ncbi:uncharacterized protein PRCAT00001943001 [Priceomyces carsonii]|uniref:uncharacterized protein n=1 Tax=Priceomyces carsonii TaxID=28549 RepID=UPI002ED81D2A|nr:unnamed protein product [Priceomyces carsonii]